MLIVPTEIPQNKRHKVIDNIHVSFHFVYLKLQQKEAKQNDPFFFLVIHEISKLIFFHQ